MSNSNNMNSDDISDSNNISTINNTISNINNANKSTKHVIKPDEPLTFFQRVKSKFREYCALYYIGLNANETPGLILYSFAILGNACMLAVFLYFFITQFISGIHDSFVTFTDNVNCESHPIVFSIDVQGTSDGYWTGNEFFQDSRAVFNFYFRDISATTTEEFTSLMNVAFKDGFLTELSKNATHLPLSLNLLYWCNFYFSTEINGMSLQMQFNGLPLSLFDSRYRSIGIGSATENCPTNPTIDWNLLLGTLLVTWDLDAYNNSCSSVIHPTLLGYFSDFDYNSFCFLFDVTAAMDVMATNLNLVPYTSVLVTIRTLRNFTFNGVEYKVELKFDPRYPSMQQMMCLTKVSGSQSVHVNYDSDHYCFMYTPLGKRNQLMPMISIFSEWGYTDGSGVVQQCTCPSAADIDECNMFKFMSIYILFPSAYNVTTDLFDEDLALSKCMELVTKYSPLELQSLVHQPAVATITKVENGNYDFCNNECALLVLFSAMLLGNRPVTATYYQLPQGACSDTFTTSWDSLVKTPPLQLTEPFVSCTLDTGPALLNAAGIAIGNASIAMPFILTGLFIFLYFIERMGIIPKSRTRYTKDDYDDVLDKFAYLLQDGKSGELGLSKHDGTECVIRQLAEEMHQFEKRPKKLDHLAAHSEFVSKMTPSTTAELSRFGITLAETAEHQHAQIQRQKQLQQQQNQQYLEKQRQQESKSEQNQQRSADDDDL